MQDQNIQLAETLGHKPPETLADLLKVLIQSGVDIKAFSNSLLQKAQQHMKLRKHMSEADSAESLQTAKAYLFLAEGLVKAIPIIEADAATGANLSAPAKQ